MKKLRSILSGFYDSTAWKIVLASYLIAIVGGLAGQSTTSTLVERALVAQVEDNTKMVGDLTQIAAEYETLKADDQVVKMPV